MKSPDPATVAVTGRRRQLWPLYAAGFVTAFGAHAVAANLARYAAGRHTSLVELGVLLALYDGAEVVLKPVFGALADRIGPRRVLLGGLVGFAMASAAFVVAAQPGLLGAARLGQGMAAAAFSPAASVLVAVAGGQKRTGRAFGGYGGVKGIGYLAGPLGGGLLVAAGGYRLLFIMLAAMGVGVAIWAGVTVETAATPPRARETLVGLTRRLSQADFVQPVIVLAGATAALSAGVGFLPVVGARHHLGPLATGAIVSALAAAAAVTQPWAGRRFDRDERPPVALAGIGLVVAAAGFAAVAAVPAAITLVVAAIAIGAGVGVATPVGFAALAAAAPRGRLGQTMGAGEVGRELGDAGGPLLVGALAGIALAAGFAGLAAVLAGAGLIVITRPTVPPVDRSTVGGDKT